MTGFLDTAIIAFGLSAGLAAAGIAVTVTMIALLVRALRSIDGFGDCQEPDWWPEFESQFADYVADRHEPRE
jgi:hypothetical protein